MKKKIVLLVILALAASVNLYGQVKRSPTKPKAGAIAAKRGTLDVEAGLVFKTGDTKPVARATFWLLKTNPETLMVNDNLERIWKTDLPGGRGSLNFSSAKRLFGSPYAPQFTAAVRQALDGDQVAKMTTGFDGKGQFAPVATGEYFLFGKYSWGKVRVTKLYGACL